ncbi:hypothetical protein ACFQX7_27650 [Luedemannella flava]
MSTELREGLRMSVELIANEVLARLREAGVQPEQLMDPAELGKELARESLRYLYRILFLLYAEARPELGVLPTNNPEYTEGYSLARLGEVASRKLVSESAGQGFHLYESLDLLFRMVNEGHNPAVAQRSPARPRRARASGSSRCARTCSCRRGPDSSAGPSRTRTPTTTRPRRRSTPGCATPACTRCCAG